MHLDGASDLTDMEQRVSYMIFGSIVTATRAFEHVTLTVNARVQLVIAKVRLKRIYRYRIFKKLQMAWLYRAEEAAKVHVPAGWRLVICYDRIVKK
jgi:hypothetical protein